MIRGYETVLILDALLPDERIEAAIKETEEFIAKRSELKNVDRRGKRRLAYKIKRKTHGQYTIFAYNAEGKVVADLERKLRLDEKVLRFLTVLKDK